MNWKLIIVLFVGLITIGCQQQIVVSQQAPNSQTELSNKGDIELDTNNGPIHGEKDDSGLVVVDNPNSSKVLVNKHRKLPDGYVPEDLVVPDVEFYFDQFLEKRQMRAEAAEALEKLFEVAEQDGVDLVAASGYRSYQTQKILYENYVARDGQKAADRYSARPGTSEHQTGLTIDLTSAQMAFKLEQTFKETNEGKWLEENAHRFGFIIRYPEGKEAITGYMYEPWHIRYVGEEIATEIYEQNITLEEYLGYGYKNEES